MFECPVYTSSSSRIPVFFLHFIANLHACCAVPLLSNLKDCHEHLLPSWLSVCLSLAAGLIPGFWLYPVACTAVGSFPVGVCVCILSHLSSGNELFFLQKLCFEMISENKDYLTRIFSFQLFYFDVQTRNAFFVLITVSLLCLHQLWNTILLW